MGRWCLRKSCRVLTLIFLGHMLPSAYAQQEKGGIAFPAPPKPAVLPSPKKDQDVMEYDLERKRRERQSREPEKIVPNREEKQQQKIQEEIAKPRPFKVFAEASWLYAKAQVSEGRSDYQADLTNHFSILYRFAKDQPASGDVSSKNSSSNSSDVRPSIFTGWRFAPFAGTGTQNNVKGRYGFLYFGPIVGVGKLSPTGGSSSADSQATAEANQGTSEGSAPAKTKEFGYHGYLLSGGIAMLHQSPPESDAYEKTDATDFNDRRGFSFDSPGVWLEARYFRLFYGALSFDVLAGTQMGKGKMFFYGGFGLGGWY